MISDELTQLHQELCAIEDEGYPVSQGDVIYGLLRAFGSDSITHVVQQIKHAQELKEGLIRAEENLFEVSALLKPFQEMVRRAQDV